MILKKIPIWLILLEIPFIYLAYQYLIRDSLAIYDASSQLAQVWYLREYLWPAMTGFNSLNLLGFDQGLLYPSLFHYAASAVSFFVGVELGVKLVVGLALIVLPLSIYLFSSLFFQNNNSRAFMTGLLLVVVVALPGYLGADVKGLVQVGLLPSFVSLPLVFLYIWSLLKPKPNWLLSSLLLSAVLLTHLVAGIFCGLFWMIVVLSKFLVTKRFNLESLKQIIVAFGLTAFFLIPFALNYSLTSQSVHLPSLLLPNVVLLLALLFIGYYLTTAKKEKLYPTIIAALVLTLVVLVDA